MTYRDGRLLSFDKCSICFLHMEESDRVRLHGDRGLAHRACKDRDEAMERERQRREEHEARVGADQARAEHYRAAGKVPAEISQKLDQVIELLAQSLAQLMASSARTKRRRRARQRARRKS
jgi:hypothetical protein